MVVGKKLQEIYSLDAEKRTIIMGKRFDTAMQWSSENYQNRILYMNLFGVELYVAGEIKNVLSIRFCVYGEIRLRRISSELNFF